MANGPILDLEKAETLSLTGQSELMAHIFEAKGIHYKDTPFDLRAGGKSNWYIDAREVLSAGEVLKLASRLMIAGAQENNWELNVVSGMGVGGSALLFGVVFMGEQGGYNLAWTQGNDKPDDRYSYGLHGASVEGKKVFVVDDTATTGDSLVTLIDMVETAGGEVAGVETLVDRSEGKVAELMHDRGYEYESVLTFHEQGGLLVPTGQTELIP